MRIEAPGSNPTWCPAFQTWRMSSSRETLNRIGSATLAASGAEAVPDGLRPCPYALPARPVPCALFPNVRIDKNASSATSLARRFSVFSVVEVPMTSQPARSWTPHALCGLLAVVDCRGDCRTTRRRPTERRVARHHWRRHLHQILATRSDQRVEFQLAAGRVGMEWRSAAGRRGRRHQRARPAHLRRRHADYDVGPAPHRRVPGSCDRKNALDLPGAVDPAARVFDAIESRQRRGLPRASTAAASCS